MPVSINNTQVVFNDATTQGTSFTGARGQVFNANGTFTIPTGITAIKVTVVGGGGGAGSYNPGCCGNPTVGNAGTASSVASGTQSISTVTGTGGGGAGPITGYGAAGTGSGGALNVTAVTGTFNTSFGGGISYGGGGLGQYSQGGSGGTAIQWFTGLTPSSTLTVTRGAAGNGTGFAPVNGTGGVIYFEW
jgi:hypothetical protein